MNLHKFKGRAICAVAITAALLLAPRLRADDAGDAGALPADTSTPATSPAASTPAVALPPASALRKAAAAVAQLYKDELASATTEDVRAALADKMMQAGLAETQDMAGKYALLDRARLLRLADGDLTDAFHAIDAINAAFIIDAEKLRIESAADATRMLTNQRALSLLAGQTATAAEAAKMADQYDFARRLIELAVAAANRSQDSGQQRNVAHVQQQLNRTKIAFDQLKSTFAILRANPNDAAANLKVGRFRCFIQGDWKRGLANLARCGDEKLKKLATREQTPDLDSSALADLADQWWDAAQQEFGPTREQIEEHSSVLYIRSVDDLTGLAQARAQKRIEDVQSMVARERGISLAQIPADAVKHDGRYFQLYQEPVTWEQAEAKCEKLGGHLMKVRDADDLKFAKKWADKAPWVGAADLHHKRKYVWWDGARVDPQLWRAGEPTGGPEDAVSLTRWGLNDLRHDWQRSYVCEWDP